MFSSFIRRLFTILFVAGLLSFQAGSAKASLIGDTVMCSGPFGTCSPSSATVGTGVEFQFFLTSQFAATHDIDLDANSISMTAVQGSGWGTGWELTLSDLDWVGIPTGVITGITNFTTNVTQGISISDIMTTAHTVTINFGSSSWANGEFLSFDLVTEHVAPVPLPAAFPLFAGGLGLLGLFGWRRKRMAAA